MTNTLHRQGKLGQLQRDYVIFAHMTAGINREGSGPKMKEFIRICLKHQPVNLGSIKQGNILQDDIQVETLVANIKDGSSASAVFVDLDTLQRVVSELIDADLGLSINVSGLLDGVQKCCHSLGTERHSVEHSLGFWGAKGRLPEREILEFNTMCGHGMVSFNLIRKMVEYVRLRRLTPKAAARVLAKCCECGVFNPCRAELLFEKLRESGFLSTAE